MKNNNNIKHVNMTIILGEVISDVKEIDNGRLVTFMVETKSYSKGKELIFSEKHKIVCFDRIAHYISENLEIGQTVHIVGSNRSKMILTENDNKVISRDVVANQVSIMN